MNLNIIDARGRSCPEPVLMAKKGVEKNPEGVEIIVDNSTARENITRFGKNAGYKVAVTQNGGEYVLTLSR